MSVGKRNKRATLLRPVVVPQNSFGERETQWVGAGRWWVEIESIAGGEVEVAGQSLGNATHKIHGAYLRGVDRTYRLTVDGRIFEINHVDNPGQRNEELELVCTETID